MSSLQACVSVVDDDALVLKSLDRLLQSAGFSVQTFSSPLAFLKHEASDAPGCVVMDLSMPALSGLDLQRALNEVDDGRPVVFISGHANVASSVDAMKAGAVDFITKPVDGEEFLRAVRSAVEKHRALREQRAVREALQARAAALTPREHEVLERVVEGKLNKQIAADLGTAEKTVKVHRARMMRKMNVGSLAELVRVWTLTRGS